MTKNPKNKKSQKGSKHNGNATPVSSLLQDVNFNAVRRMKLRYNGTDSETVISRACLLNLKNSKSVGSSGTIVPLFTAVKLISVTVIPKPETIGTNKDPAEFQWQGELSTGQPFKITSGDNLLKSTTFRPTDNLAMWVNSGSSSTTQQTGMFRMAGFDNFFVDILIDYIDGGGDTTLITYVESNPNTSVGITYAALDNMAVGTFTRGAWECTPHVPARMLTNKVTPIPTTFTRVP